MTAIVENQRIMDLSSDEVVLVEGKVLHEDEKARANDVWTEFFITLTAVIAIFFLLYVGLYTTTTGDILPSADAPPSPTPIVVVHSREVCFVNQGVNTETVEVICSELAPRIGILFPVPPPPQEARGTPEKVHRPYLPTGQWPQLHSGISAKHVKAEKKTKGDNEPLPLAIHDGKREEGDVQMTKRMRHRRPRHHGMHDDVNEEENRADNLFRSHKRTRTGGCGKVGAPDTAALDAPISRLTRNVDLPPRQPPSKQPSK